MAYTFVIVIFAAFAKKNADKIRFENKRKIYTLGQLFLSLYEKENDAKQLYSKNHCNIHFIIKYVMTHVMLNKKTTNRRHSN